MKTPTTIAPAEQAGGAGPGLVRRAQLRLATHLALRSARRDTLRRIGRLDPRRILVLCYGNIYRSPFVSAYLARAFGAWNATEIRSAGFHPRTGRSTPDEFIGLVQERAGFDLSRHRSTLFSRDDAEWADAVLIMDRHNWHALAACPWGTEVSGKVLWLGAFAPGASVEVVDPYGAGRIEQTAIIDRMIECSDEFCRRAMASCSEGS